MNKFPLCFHENQHFHLTVVTCSCKKMSYNKLDKFLIKMSNDLPRRTLPFPESAIDIYCNDYLYTNIKNIVTFDKPVCLNKWSRTHEFIISGINIRGKFYFDLHYPGKIRFDTEYIEDYPYFGKQHRIIENIINQDNGHRKPIEIVREIASATHVLVMPYFVKTTRFQFLRYV